MRDSSGIILLGLLRSSNQEQFLQAVEIHEGLYQSNLVDPTALYFDNFSDGQPRGKNASHPGSNNHFPLFKLCIIRKGNHL